MKRSRKTLLMLAPLALLLVVWPGIVTGFAVGDVGGPCCCKTTDRPADTCCGDDHGAPATPCDCEADDGGLPLALPAARPDVACPLVFPLTRRGTLPLDLGSTFVAEVRPRARTGPPLFVRHCAFLI